MVIHPVSLRPFPALPDLMNIPPFIADGQEDNDIASSPESELSAPQVGITCHPPPGDFSHGD